jgi:class 3 adenylate cyclase
MKNRDNTARLALHAAELAYSLILLAWLFVPMYFSLPGLYAPLRVPFELLGAYGGATVRYALTALVLLIPAVRLYKLACPFMDRLLPGLADPRRTFPIVLSLVSSILALATIFVHVLVHAESGSYFAASSPLLYAVFLTSLAYNAFFLILFITRRSLKDESYREYLEFRRDSGRSGLRQSIQRRLLLSFLSLILVIVGVLSFVLMRNFSRTILSSVFDSGKALAERAASVVKANFGDDIAVDDYFAIEARKNAEAVFRFDNLTFCSRDVRGEGFQVAASTERFLVGQRIEEHGFALKESLQRYDPDRRVFEFLAPVLVRDILVGFVQVNYGRDVIYKPYFRSQVQVLLIAAVFLYATAFLIYLVARNIVFPILFLRMSVNSISETLSAMVRGRLRVSAEALRYKDRVRTQDEIKGLSHEIGNMATVIRGLIPYISVSTLQHAEREKPTTVRKELAFLFSDVRGFTTLCESLSPDQVVSLLNHYLDLQSNVILANGGDIDKFVGDEIMAVFDGPHMELAACKSAMEIRKAMAEQKELSIKAGRKALHIGIGIHAGPVVFGSVGAKERMDFTSIGDAVNLAARLEGANKTYGTKSLISETILAKVEEQFLCREIDVLKVMGKSQPVRIYEVLQEHEKAALKLRVIRQVFEQGLAQYRQQQWDAAEKAFSYLKGKYRDKPSEVFLRRIELFRRNPPPKKWDGVFAMSVK